MAKHLIIECLVCGADDIERVQGGALECCTCGHGFDDQAGPLADVLDMSTWTVVADTTEAQSPEQQAEAYAEAEAFSDYVRQHPPKRFA